MRPLQVLKPFFILALIVTAFGYLLTLYVMPRSAASLREIVTKVRADVITRILEEGRFVELDRRLVFHYRAKGEGGTLEGVLLQDRREKDKVATYIAERGAVVTINEADYLVLEKGSMQRQSADARENGFVSFESYAFDLDDLNPANPKAVYRPRERGTIELLTIPADDERIRNQAGRVRAELHDRLSGPLFAFAAMAIAFAALGAPRTTRQGRRLVHFGRRRRHRRGPLGRFRRVHHGPVVDLRYRADVCPAAWCDGHRARLFLYAIRATAAQGRAGFDRGARKGMMFFDQSARRYFAMRFIKAVLIVFATVSALAYVLDLFELLRRGRGRHRDDDRNLDASCLASPAFRSEQVFPFGILFGAIAAFLGLSRRLELVIARSAGVSAWQFITPSLIVAFLLGLLGCRGTQSTRLDIEGQGRAARNAHLRQQERFGRSNGVLAAPAQR